MFILCELQQSHNHYMRLPVCLLAEMSSTENNLPLFNLRNLKEEKKQQKEVMI